MKMKIASTIFLYFIIITVSYGQNQKCIDDHNAGVKAYNKKDYSSALYYYKKAADNCGMNESFNALGRMYYYGHGVEKDDCEAMKWFNKASRLDDNSSAIVNMIKEFYNGDTCDKSKSKPTERLYNNPSSGTKATTNTTRKSNQTVQLERGTYVGETINGKPDGKGVLTQKDGQVISGEFKNGVEHGRCLNRLQNGFFSAN
jgi:TPR repeat protein